MESKLTCTTCGRDNFKSKGGLTRHSKDCVAQVDTKETEDQKLYRDRQILKLTHAIVCCLDATEKHKLETELKRLKEG